MTIIDRVVKLFTEHGDMLYLGEAVTQKEHALQAATLAEKAGAPASHIAAALLHDIGHIIHESGSDTGDDPKVHGADDLHEEKGYRWLSEHFGPQVSDPVRLHVPAKRYLCAIDADYINLLTETSIKSLKDQGGPMVAEEVRSFEAEPFAKAAVSVRRWDDAAKVPNLKTPDLLHFCPYLDVQLNQTS